MQLFCGSNREYWEARGIMETYDNHNIQEIPLSSPYFRLQVERFLRANGLRMEALDAYYTIQNANGDILAGAGLRKDVIKCVAVSPGARSEGLTAPLISHILSQHSSTNLKVFTKPENEAIFASLGFHTLGRAPLAILMENGRELEQYCAYLKHFRFSGRSGVVLMHANPFTLGHRYLLEQALHQVDRLFVISVQEDLSFFPYAERMEMISRGVPDDVVVLNGSPYQISAATFPTYFLKDLSAAAETQMQLDLDIFARHIAPALDASVRFVGSEPEDPLTARYNVLMKERLREVEVVEISRLEVAGSLLSASRVRAELQNGELTAASALCPETDLPFFLAAMAERALLLELDTPLKPGLVGPDSNGAHKDMDYTTMRRGIAALRPYWSRMAMAASADELQALGIEAEEAMLAATGGVNTHRGSIFCLGLAIAAANRRTEVTDNEQDIQNRLVKIARTILYNQLENSELRFTPHSIKDARGMAADGYRVLFEDWLPYLRRDTSLQKLLLRIMSTLDDTCVIHRVGEKRALEVKREAAALLEVFSEGKLQDMCRNYAAERISPGGAADMLALTIFIDSIIK